MLKTATESIHLQLSQLITPSHLWYELWWNLVVYVALKHAASIISSVLLALRACHFFWRCADLNVSCALFPLFIVCLWDLLLNQNRHLRPDTMGSIVSLWKESMCFADALAAANLRDNFYIQPLIKEHSYAWVTSSEVPGGCGKGSVSKCGGQSHLSEQTPTLIVLCWAREDSL